MSRFCYMGLLDGFFALGAGTNTVREGQLDETKEGIKGSLQEEAGVKLKDEDLIVLKKEWEKKWGQYEPELKRRQLDAERYWLGKHFTNVEHAGVGTDKRPMVDNAIFESLETFLPVATKRNPEPQVTTDDTKEGKELSDRVQKMLIYHADRLRMKLKLKKVTRYWAVYFLGVIKVGWSEANDDIAMSIIRTTRLILDPDATIDEGEYTGEYIGEIKKDSAANLVKRFPNKSEEIKEGVHNKMGTEVSYTEWWTDEMVFWTLKSEVLGKEDNPHWNQQEEKQKISDTGEIESEMVAGNNHFPHPKKPYIFLSVFNLGLHPHDDTSLIMQNLANQDIINKRNRQIDKNADHANAGLVVSGDHFSQEEAQRAAESLRAGGVVWVPTGDVNTAVKRDQPTSLPPFVFNDLLDKRQRLLDIFGTRGTAPTGLLDEKTVRGKILTRSADESRTGGGVSEFLEQVADLTFNWFVQLMYVYYDERHYGAVLGAQEGASTVVLSNIDFNRKLTVSVKEGSLIPKDDVTMANQAVDLTAAGKMSLVDLYEKLEYANPQEMATRAWLEINAPHLLYGTDPRVLQAIQEQALQKAQEQAQKNQPTQKKQGGGQQAPQDGGGLLQQVPIQQ